MNIDINQLKCYPMSFKLQKLRCASGIMQKELAKAISCSQASITAWERGIYMPSKLMLERLRQFYNLPFDFFIEDDIETAKLKKK